MLGVWLIKQDVTSCRAVIYCAGTERWSRKSSLSRGAAVLSSADVPGLIPGLLFVTLHPAVSIWEWGAATGASLVSHGASATGCRMDLTRLSAWDKGSRNFGEKTLGERSVNLWELKLVQMEGQELRSPLESSPWESTNPAAQGGA